MKRQSLMIACLAVLFLTISSFKTARMKSSKLCFNSKQYKMFNAAPSATASNGTNAYFQARFTADLDGNDNCLGVSVQAILGGNENYATMTDGQITWGGTRNNGFYNTSGLVVYWYGGGQNGSFTIPDGTYFP